MNINHQIITLEGNKKYFVLEELVEGREEYTLVLNIENENDIEILCKKQTNNGTILTEIKDDALLNDLAIKFKELLEKDQEMYS